MAFFSIFFVKCRSFCDLRSIRGNEIYCAMLGKKSKCKIKNGKEGEGVEWSKKEKMEVCACAFVRVHVCMSACTCVRVCVGHHPQTLKEIKHRPP